MVTENQTQSATFCLRSQIQVLYDWWGFGFSRKTAENVTFYH